jgi:dUTP pyrophosphatase
MGQVTPPRMAYLASPIDQAIAYDTSISTIKEKVKYLLLDNGIEVVYDPSEAFRVLSNAKPGDEIQAVNVTAMDLADCVVAVMPSGVPSVGVPIEIATAAATGKPVAVLTDTLSWVLAGLEGDIGLFPLDEEGAGLAVQWIASHERVEVTEDPKTALPFMVVRKAKCGRDTAHDPHEFGEHYEEDCDGLNDLTPVRKYDGDAGWDLIVSEGATIEPGEQVDVPCGVAVAIPEWAFGRITGRSSTLRKRGLLVNEGIIDSGFRGELFILVRNMTDKPVDVEAGERLGQLIIHANESRGMLPVKVSGLVPSDRGLAGFGSTGA